MLYVVMRGHVSKCNSVSFRCAFNSFWRTLERYGKKENAIVG